MRAILTYHSIDDSGSVISVSEAAFARHVEWLASGRVQVTSVDELLRLPESADAVAVTFDDGCVSFGEIAAPRLAAHGLPCTLFVVSDRVGTTNAWNGVAAPGIPGMPLLDWTALTRLMQRGVTLASHTRTHPALPRLRGGALAAEIVGAADAIEQHTGRRPTGFAYPYGGVSDEAAAIVAATYSWGCTTELRGLSSAEDRSRLPRLDMYYFRRPGALERWGTTRFNSYVKLRSRVRRMKQAWTERRDSQ
jgi:peptidoglycan/xylan/chitin deacetylase (PgdA/CDA1 family)